MGSRRMMLVISTNTGSVLLDLSMVMVLCGRNRGVITNLSFESKGGSQNHERISWKKVERNAQLIG